MRFIKCGVWYAFLANHSNFDRGVPFELFPALTSARPTWCYVPKLSLRNCALQHDFGPEFQ